MAVPISCPYFFTSTWEPSTLTWEGSTSTWGPSTSTWEAPAALLAVENGPEGVKNVVWGLLASGQQEIRQYRARWRDDDQHFGDWSDIVQVTASP